MGAVSQQLLLPTTNDPKLWVVRCGEGQEREVIVCLLQKCYDLASKGTPLLIKSAFCQDHLQVRAGGCTARVSGGWERWQRVGGREKWGLGDSGTCCHTILLLRLWSGLHGAAI